MAMEKVQPTSVSFQSPGAEWVEADELGQRQIEGREGVHLADRQMHRESRGRHQEAVVAGGRDGAFSVQERMQAFDDSPRNSLVSDPCRICASPTGNLPLRRGVTIRPRHRRIRLCASAEPCRERLKNRDIRGRLSAAEQRTFRSLMTNAFRHDGPYTLESGAIPAAALAAARLVLLGCA